MEAKKDVIYMGKCNFCEGDRKETEKPIMFINFQAICYDCALKIFLPILDKFEEYENEKSYEEPDEGE